MDTFKRKKQSAVFLLAAVLLALLWWGNNMPRTEEYVFASERVPQGWDGARIVHLSDLHGKEFGKDNRRLLQAVSDAQPDLIVVTGDLADAQSGLDAIPAVLEGLSALASTYYVTGNHEWGAGFVGELREMLKNAGVHYLRNEFVILERGESGLVLAGIDDPNGYADQKTPAQLAEEVYAQQGDPFWLLLAHRNTQFPGEYCLLGADLTLCGHGHGGIWRLPLTDGLINTAMELFPSWTNGFYACTCGKCENAQVFVSRGLGNSPRIPRINNRPEVAVITLQSTP